MRDARAAERIGAIDRNHFDRIGLDDVHTIASDLSRTRDYLAGVMKRAAAGGQREVEESLRSAAELVEVASNELRFWKISIDEGRIHPSVIS